VDPVFTWPEGVTAAAAFTFDVDAESCVLAHDPTATSRMSLMSHQAYGPRVAVPKLLRMLERQEVRATFFVPGFTAECHPQMTRAIVDAGHEIGHHGYLHEQMQGIDRDTEARYLDRGLRALKRVADVEPTGYRAPWWEMNWHTPALLHERGFRYDSSLLDGDAPYRFAVAFASGGLAASEQQAGSDDTLVEVPVDWALDDWEQYAFYPGWTGSGVIESPAKAREMWLLEAMAQHRQGGCWVLTNHPFISGRPSRLDSLEELVEHVKALDGMWVTTLAEIAEYTEQLAPVPRRHTRFEVPHFPDAPVLTDGVPVGAEEPLGSASTPRSKGQS
jgi:peptidoglycan-N-acetylglucosamine deacetylase